MNSVESATELRIKLFGTFEVHIDGVPMPPVRSRKVQWLLALLTLRHGREVERVWLSGVLWPESSQSQALFNLRQTLSHLRAALGSTASRLHSSTSRTLLLNLTEANVDVIAFDAAISKGGPEALREAIAYYRGPLLEECSEDWAWHERREREQNYLNALETLAAVELAQGETGEAMAFLRLVIRLDPTREHAQRILMQTLASTGDYSAAVQVYRDLRLWLHNELHTDPDSATETLFQQIRQEARRQKPFAAPVASAVPPPRNLPRPLTALVGRVVEVSHIIAGLRAGRLVTLTGMGGIGKTRLAIAVAEELADEYPAGIVFIDLAPTTDPALVATKIRATLELKEESGRSVSATLKDYLKDKELLLVLDNCEHLLESCAELTRALLDSCASLHILTTSRQALGLVGECVWSVPPLGMPEIEPLTSPRPSCLQRVDEAEAARLFIARAQSVIGGFQLTEANAPSIAQICWKLDGIPLALELAAVWVRALSPVQLAQHLDKSLNLLLRGDRTADPRHQTLRNTMEWSYGLLTRAEQTLLARLAVFAGGWTLDALGAVCFDNDTGGQMLSLLDSLIEKSLVEVGERNGEAWYRLLEPVRQYALEQLEEASEEPELRRRHQDYFLALAERRTQQLNSAHIVEALERMEADYDNFRAALRFSLNDAMDVPRGECALRLAIALMQFQTLRGYYQEGMEGIREALKCYEAPEDAPLRAKALVNAAWLAHRMGDTQAQHEFGKAAEALYRRVPVSSGLVQSLRILGAEQLWKDDFPAAIAYFEEGIALARRIGDRNEEAYFQNLMGIAVRQQGDLKRAQELTASAARHFQAVGLLAYEAIAQHNLGVAFVADGKEAEAKTHFLRSLEIHRRLRNRSWMGINLFDLGRVALLEGNLAEARAMEEEALALCQAGDRSMVPMCHQLLARIECMLGDTATAWRHLKASVTFAHQINAGYDIPGGLVVACGLLREKQCFEWGARLLTATMAWREAKNFWLPQFYLDQLAELAQDFETALGAEAFADLQRMATPNPEELLDEILNRVD